jgi:aryl-alcohol dehydrogenase (NADP+)
MNYIPFGNTGLKVSPLCFGCMSYGSPAWRDWVLNEKASRPFMERALEAGINFFDTADIYSNGESEAVLGRALAELAADREHVVIATKVFMRMGDSPNQRGLARKHLRHAIDASLKRLGTDYVDLYQIHRFDPSTPMEETLEGLDDIVRAGKALHVGASSMYAWQFARFLYLADQYGYPRFASMQNHYNLVYREEEREMIPLCRFEGVAVMPWSPLARGFLTGSRGRSKDDETTRARSDDYARRMYYQDSDFDVVDEVTRIARQRGVSNAQVAMAWLRQQPGVTSPIIGATKLNHLDEAIAALELELSEDELAALAASYRPHPVLGHAYDNPVGVPGGSSRTGPRS